MTSSGCTAWSSGNHQIGYVRGHILWYVCPRSLVCEATPWTPTPIWFKPSDGERSVATSHEDGSYEAHLPAGTYEVILPPEVVSGPLSVRVEPGQTVTANYLLRKPSG